jgi:hypothetical protein
MLILDGLMLTVVRLPFPSLEEASPSAPGVPLLPYRAANPSDKIPARRHRVPQSSPVASFFGSYTSSPRAQSRFLRPEFQWTHPRTALKSEGSAGVSKTTHLGEGSTFTVRLPGLSHSSESSANSA